MRWKQRKQKTQTEWHPWFAWHPVMVGDGWVWLETVQRRGHWEPNPHYGMMPYVSEPEEYWEWEYKL